MGITFVAGATLAVALSMAAAASADGAPTAAQWRSMGHTHEASGTLRGGCHYYRYRYAVSPPAGTWWTLETFVVGPHKSHLAADVIISGADKTSGTKRYQLCRETARPGRFTIKAKLTYRDYPAEYSGWVRTSHFKLKKP